MKLSNWGNQMSKHTSAQTERLHASARDFELRSASSILNILLAGQRSALASVEAAIPQIEAGAGHMARSIQADGRLYYVAAGSSGLMCFADAAEIPGTFGISAKQITICMAGGIPSSADMPGFTEDDEASGIVAAENVVAADTVIAVSASGNTAYATGFAKVSKQRGARVIAIANNAGAALFNIADVAILLETPAEVVAGSTRLGAGTSQKVALNMMSTLMGVQLGHVHDGMMVNVVADNKKLVERAKQIICTTAGVSSDQAERYLADADGAVKVAILLASGATSAEVAKAILDQENGQLRAALARL